MPDALDLSIPEIRPKEFELIRNLAHSTFGLDLRQGKEKLVSARLGKHLRAGGFRSFEDYYKHVQTDRSGESLLALIDALTTNHTSFLREPDHFRFLSQEILPALAKRSSVTIWSAASSTGEEPYSLLFTALDTKGMNPAGIRIIGSDISRRVLAAARDGVYAAERLAGVPQMWVQKYFQRQNPASTLKYQVKTEFRALIDFRRLNLMDAIPSSYRFPVVFCRNVMIYFNKTTQENLVNRLVEAIEPGGYLFVGHAESLTGINHPFRYVRPAVYRRKD